MPLKTVQKTYLYILFSIICIGIVSTSVYYLLGGFKDLIIVTAKNNIYSIAGKDFKGKISNDTIGLYFNEMRNLVETGKIKGDLCLVNYQEEGLKGKEVHQFIGVLLGEGTTEIPAGLIVREIECETSFKAALVMHPLVRINSEKVQAQLYEFAQEKGYNLDNYSLEIFYEDNSMIVEMFGIEPNEN